MVATTTTSRLYAKRRRRNGLMMILAYAAALFGVGWLVLILGVLLWEGLSGVSLQVFTEMTPPPGGAGGLLNPIVGSLLMTVLAIAIGTPIASWRAPTWPSTAATRVCRASYASSTTSC